MSIYPRHNPVPQKYEPLPAPTLEEIASLLAALKETTEKRAYSGQLPDARQQLAFIMMRVHRLLNEQKGNSYERN